MDWCDGSKQLRFEFDGVMPVTSLEFRSDLLVGHAPHFPCTVKMLESRATKPLLREVPKNQVAFGHRGVWSQVPGLANPEVTKQIVGGIGLERNRHQVTKEFRRSREVRIVACEEGKAELRELAKQRQIGLPGVGTA